MLEAIYIIISLQVLILFAVFYLVLQRGVTGLLKSYTETRRNRFEPIILNLFNDPTATETLQSGLLPGDRKIIKGLLLLQATQLKGQDRLNLTTVFEETGYVGADIRVLRSRMWWRRLEAAADLGIMQSRIAVPVLIETVKDPVEDVRLAAVRALGQMNESSGLRTLLDEIEKGEYWTGSNIVEALIGMGYGIAPEIVRKLEATRNPDARLLYMQVCGLLQISEALGSIRLLLRDHDEETRISAAQALGRIGDVSVAESLIIALDDESWAVRAQAAKSLGKLGDRQAVKKLTQVLSDENWWVRHNAASALYQLAEEGVIALREASRLDEGAPSVAAKQVLAERALGV